MGTARVRAALIETKSHLSKYWMDTLSQRIPGPTQAGSVFNNLSTVEEVEVALISATWLECYNPDIREGCTGFLTYDLTGRMGVVDLDSLQPETIVVMDDRKRTNKLTPLVGGVPGKQVTHTVLIIGVEDGREVVFTVHPGDPVRSSEVVGSPDLPRVTTVGDLRTWMATTGQEAQWAKVVPQAELTKLCWETT